jgi:predicted  nucleic acid-binding Zn-ribbon protein
MELAKVEKLIEKYLEAETTLKEEEILKDFFAKDDVPDHLMEYKSLFNYFNLSSFEKSDRSIALPRKTKNLKWLSIAAMVVFFVGVYSINQNNLSEKEESMVAYQETQKALNMISQSLNKGNSAIAQLQTFEVTQNKIFNNK